MLRRSVVLLLTIFLANCGEPSTKVAIPFVPVFGTRILDCDNAGSAVQLTDLRLYVSNVQLITRSGELVDVRLDVDGRWQQPDLALLDFEDGSGACANGTSDTSMSLRGFAERADYRGLQFTLGVPFQRNHADPLQAEVPLGDPAMHWHWRGGYKFLRAGIRTDDDGFWIHLGSTGCEGTVRNITACRSPNRVTVRLDEFVPGIDTVAIDLEALLTDTDLVDGVANDCSSGPAEESCEAPFRALGLDLHDGNARDQQLVFRRKVAN
ncbi:MAG: metallo-mystery pair system four-Cys motif protein [Gammaproteobacteria bacterium]|nr:metallo-mystery pair system four-Cys motif protein [Gammaproteobacteria bacterium]MDH3750077.1 metallo-mystery pair system four-Cys motif protein [Gammaproteobacteria bacterium]